MQYFKKIKQDKEVENDQDATYLTYGGWEKVSSEDTTFEKRPE